MHKKMESYDNDNLSVDSHLRILLLTEPSTLSETCAAILQDIPHNCFYSEEIELFQYSMTPSFSKNWEHQFL